MWRAIVLHHTARDYSKYSAFVVLVISGPKNIGINGEELYPN